ncbi:MAG: SdpI family protein [Clostridia bacterium]|nr:SdpI family protein [Clostridia bacterium]
MKKYTNKIIITSLVILMPMVVGFIMWNKLPDIMPTHWGFDGQVDGYSDKLAAVVTGPLLLLAGHLLCLFVTAKDSKNAERNEKMFNIVMWIMPVISLITSYVTYSAAMGNANTIDRIMPIFIGLIFVVIGNYLPKCRMNYTIGIKIPTVYTSEANWYATHRMGGKMMMLAGFLTMLSAAFEEDIFVSFLLTAVVIAAIVPMIYSYIFYKKEKAAGKELQPLGYVRIGNKTRKINGAALACVLIFVVAIMFTGEIEFNMGEDFLEITSFWYSDFAVKYDSIDSIEYREDFSTGSRTMGFGSAKLLMGTFTNKECGTYTLYAYTGADAHIVIKSGEKTLAIGCKTVEETQALYDNLLATVQ